MDFRSQLSAFSDRRDDERGDRDRDRGGFRGRDRDRNSHGRDRGRDSDRDRSRGRDVHSHSHSHRDRDRGNPSYRYDDRGGRRHDGRDRSASGDRRSYSHHGIDDRRRSYDHVGGARRRSDSPPRQRRRHRSPDRDVLRELRECQFRIPRGMPPPRDPNDVSITRHIAILVLCIEDLPYEHIWRHWCSRAPPNTWVSLIAHAKHPNRVTSEWLKQRLLVYPPKPGRGNSFLDPEFLTRRPEWGSVEITRAMLDLLKNGIRIGMCKAEDPRFSADRYVVHSPDNKGQDTREPTPMVDQFVYVSESCLPVATPEEMFDQVKDTHVSWVNARNRKDDGTPKNLYESDQFAGIHRRVPGQFRWKGDQWVLLCRRHANQILEIDRHLPPKQQLWQSFRDINASDEMYFPTCLALLNWLRWSDPSRNTDREHRPGWEPPEEKVLKRPVTYTDWTQGMRNPASFTKGVSDFRRIAQLARSKGCLFARKFALYQRLPGVAPRDHVVTGQISTTDWDAIIADIATSEGKTVSSSTPTTNATDGEGSKASTEADANNDKESGLAMSSVKEEEEEIEEGQDEDDDAADGSA